MQSNMKKQIIIIGLIVVLSIFGAFYILGSEKKVVSDEHGHGGSGHEEHQEHEEKGHTEKADEHEEKGHAGHGDEGHEEKSHAEPAEESAEPKKGPHGGRLFNDHSFALEVTIFEDGVEPQFRVYVYKENKPLDPRSTQVSITLERLGRPPQKIQFAQENDYLKGDAIIFEPHSFIAKINARHGGESYDFKFEQVEARIAMSDAQLASNGVRIAEVGPANIQTRLSLLGEVQLNQDRSVHIVPRLSGLVESVPVNAGDQVSKGQLLAVISSQALADQRSDWLALQQRVTLARSVFASEKKLWQAQVSAEQDYLQAEQALQQAEIAERAAKQKLVALGADAASNNLTRYEVRSPIDGVLTEKNIAVGTLLKEDSDIFVVSDLSSVWISMQVYAKDLNAVRVDQDVTVKANAFDAQASGKLTYVGSIVGEQTRTATARVVLPNPKQIWKPGLPVTVDLVTEKTEVPLAISAQAVQTLNDWTVVFGRFGDEFEARVVTLGRSDGQTIEVLDGLNAGDRYAASNSYLIKADIGKSAASHDH